MDENLNELDAQIKVLEERMAKHQAQYESALDRLRIDMAKRENRIVYAVFGAVGLGVTILGLGIAFLGFLLAGGPLVP